MSRNRPTIITIGPSHYCEKARWGLDRIGFAYDDEMRAPVAAQIRVRRLGLRPVPVLVDGQTVLGDSTEILPLRRGARSSQAARLLPPRLPPRAPDRADLGPLSRGASIVRATPFARGT